MNAIFSNRKRKLPSLFVFVLFHMCTEFWVTVIRSKGVLFGKIKIMFSFYNEFVCFFFLSLLVLLSDFVDIVVDVVVVNSTVNIQVFTSFDLWLLCCHQLVFFYIFMLKWTPFSHNDFIDSLCYRCCSHNTQKNLPKIYKMKTWPLRVLDVLENKSTSIYVCKCVYLCKKKKKTN